MSNPLEFDHYEPFLREIKDRIATARVRAALAVNAELTNALPSPDELRIAIDEGRRAFLQANG